MASGIQPGIQYEFLFVGKEEDSFVENYAYDLGDGDEHQGRLFITLEISNNPADAEQIGEHIFDTVRKSFFADLEQDPSIRFENALKDVNKQLRLLKSERSSQFIGNINAVIAAVSGNNIFLTQCGEAEAYLSRRRFCSIISEDLYDKDSKDIFSNIANGVIEADDFILFSSTRLLRYISKNDLARLVSSRNVVAVLGELKDYLAGEIVGRMAFIGILAANENKFADEKQEKQHVATVLSKAEPYVAKAKTVLSFVNKGTKRVFDFALDVANRLVKEKGRFARGNGNTGFAIGNWNRDKILGALIVIVLVLTVGIWWLRGRAEEQQKLASFQKVLNEVREGINTAETTGQYNKDQAGQMLNDAEKKALNVLNARYFSAKANELLKLIQDARDKLDGVLHPQVKLVADLSQKRANVSALGLLGIKGVLYAYEYNALYPIMLDKVQDPLTIDDNETVVSASVFTDKDSLLFYTKSGKIIEYKDNRMNFVPSAAGVFHKATAFQAYNNKVYLLEPAVNQIWKYTRRRDKFDSPEAYNIDGDVKNGISMAIDGNVYVLNGDGVIVKFLSGNKQNLTIKKYPTKPLTAPIKIFTQLNMPNLYVLEPKERRVLVYFKDDRSGGLIYTAQYIFDDVGELRDLYFDKDANKLFVMDENKIYQVDVSK